MEVLSHVDSLVLLVPIRRGPLDLIMSAPATVSSSSDDSIPPRVESWKGTLSGGLPCDLPEAVRFFALLIFSERVNTPRLEAALIQLIADITPQVIALGWHAVSGQVNVFFYSDPNGVFETARAAFREVVRAAAAASSEPAMRAYAGDVTILAHIGQLPPRESKTPMGEIADFAAEVAHRMEAEKAELLAHIDKMSKIDPGLYTVSHGSFITPDGDDHPPGSFRTKTELDDYNRRAGFEPYEVPSIMRSDVFFPSGSESSPSAPIASPTIIGSTVVSVAEAELRMIDEALPISTHSNSPIR